MSRMKCPKCGGLLSIEDDRNDYESFEIYRFRACKECGNKMYTIEYEIEPDEALFELWDKLVRPVGGIPERKREGKSTTERIEQIINMYEMGYSVREIARAMGYTENLIRFRLRNAKVEKRDGYYY